MGGAGTPHYMSLAVLKGGLYGFSDDWYAAAVCIGFLLGDNYLAKIKDYHVFVNEKEQSLHVNFNIGSGLPLPADHLAPLRDILYGMTKRENIHRLPRKDAVDRFREVSLDYFLQKTNDDAEKIIISDHFAMGCALRSKLDNLCNHKANPKNFSKLKEELTSAISIIDDI